MAIVGDYNMRSSSLRAIALRSVVASCVLVSSGIVVSARAELPPEAYARMQREAPESLDVEVFAVTMTSVRNEKLKTVTTEVVASARVRGVERTSTKLVEGSVISIRYTHVAGPPMPGASEVPILKCGQKVPAFLQLQEQGKAYRPAAGGYSFDRVNVTDVPKVT